MSKTRKTIKLKALSGADGQIRTDDLLITNHCIKNDIAIVSGNVTLQTKQLLTSSPDCPAISFTLSEIQKTILQSITFHNSSIIQNWRVRSVTCNLDSGLYADSLLRYAPNQGASHAYSTCRPLRCSGAGVFGQVRGCVSSWRGGGKFGRSDSAMPVPHVPASKRQLTGDSCRP
jgi:hypothetical protein